MRDNRDTISRSSRWLRAARLVFGLVLLPFLLVIAVGAALSGQPCGQIVQLSGRIVDGKPKPSAERRS